MSQGLSQEHENQKRRYNYHNKKNRSYATMAAFKLFFSSYLNKPRAASFLRQNCKKIVIPDEVIEAVLNTNKRII